MREIKFRAELGERTYEVATRKPKHKDAKGWYKTQGYIKRLVTEHPYADSRGYVMEHRLVIEEKMGEFLPKDAVVHHVDGDRSNNAETNLKLIDDQKSHAKVHLGERNDNGRFVAEQPIFTEIKFRFLNKNTNLTRIYTLQELIATTYRRGQFEFRGRWTGLKDRNGRDIFEGDIGVMTVINEFGSTEERRGVMEFTPDAQFAFKFESNYDYSTTSSPPVVIGNIYENPNLLK